MRGARRSRRSLGPILLGAWVLIGCYRPNINDGGFLCREAGSKRCPDGYTCGADNRCWKQADGGFASDASDVADRPDGMPDADAQAMCIFEALPGCTPSDAGLCDPVCQTGGCGCREKCSVNTQGTVTCNPLGQGIKRALMQTCDITSKGSADQTDPCLPGLVCLEDACSGAGTGRCYKFCRTDKDCDNAPCIDSDTLAGLRVCDVPYRDCKPTLPTNCPGASATMGCWLASSDPTKTICDCEFPPNLGANEICTRSRECNPGLVCAERGGDFRCVAVCELAQNGGDCVFANAMCRPFTVNGVSNPTFGFCD